jgi:formylglycine-generating enzyme required for sulfatase activity
MLRRSSLWLVLLASAGCFSSSNPGSGPDANAMDAADDALDATAVPDAVADAAPDAGADATLQDAPADTYVADTYVADTAPGDSSVVDAPPDASALDAAPDASEAGASGLVCPPVDAGTPGSGTAAASCSTTGPGLSNCGAGGTDSCCTSLEVPCGTYYRGYTNPGDGGANFTSPASVSSFRLDEYDVTVGRFRQFVNAVLPADGGAGWTPAPGSGKHAHLNGGMGLVDYGATTDGGVAYETGWLASDDTNIAPTDANLDCFGIFETWTPTPGSQENLPINCVNWYEAYAFCIWDGGFLPSEAEWEYAAAGGSQQREYPWGETDPGTASQYAIYGSGTGYCYYPGDTSTSDCTGQSNIAPVGSLPAGAGLWGQLDLEGNMFVWNLDGFGYSTYNTLCPDCTDTTNTANRVLRGSSFFASLPALYPAQRNDTTPTTRNRETGFRCARTP